MGRRNALMLAFLDRAAMAEDITEVNIAAGETAQELRVSRMARSLWVVVICLMASDLLSFGPVDLGLLPDLHIFQHLFGHPWGQQAGSALYGGVTDDPHFLGVNLPWSNLYG